MYASASPRRRTLAFALAGVLAGLLLAGAFSLWEANRRAHLLAEVNFRTEDPGVPDNVLNAVRGAEDKAYQQMGPIRTAAENVQDAVALLMPRLAFAGDFSIGPYRIKASTISETLDFAIQQGYLTLNSDRSSRYNEVLPFFALQPSINDWEASVVFEFLRQRHPRLQTMSWEEIAADPNAIAKLYSGYTGAGGAWSRWEADLVPGDVARQRLGYDPTTGQYAGIPSAGG